MSFNKWPKRSAEKNYFMVPNEIFSIGLDFREISLYSYLLRCENRKTYQCYPSYKTIGHAIGMSENTVAKYVRQLEEKGLIYTEPTLVQSKDGKPLNGNLLYTIRPIPGVLEAFYERQFRQLEEDRKRFEQERQTLLKEAREQQAGEQEFGEGSFTAVQLLFRGVNNPLALRKRYRDLIKIFHPDNLFGDGELAGQINKEYLKRKQEERFW